MNQIVFNSTYILFSPLMVSLPFVFSNKPKEEQYLVQWAVPQLHDIDALEKMVDPSLRGLYPPKQISQFADIIALCLQVSTVLV